MMPLFRNTPGFIDASMVVISTGAAFTAGTVYAFVQRDTDDKWLWADQSWNVNKPTTTNIPVMSHVSGGGWGLIHTPANADDTYFINCIDSAATCYPDNYSHAVLGVPATNSAVGSLESIVSDVHDHEESVIAMLATLSPYFSTGAKFFVSENGNDTTNDGASERPFATIGRAMTECVAARHDTIIVEQKAASWAEQVVMNKEAVLLLGSGASCKLDPGVAATDDTIKVTAPNCAVLGFGEIMGRNGHRAVYAYNADGVVVQKNICRTDLTADIDAVVIEECLLPVIGPELSCSHCDGNGLVIKSTIKACHWARITGVTAHQCGGDGIRLEGNVDRGILRDNVSHDNAGYGIYAAGSHNIIDKSNRVHDNVLGQIYNVGGLNKVYTDETSALAIITGAKNLGIDVMTSFDRIVMSQGAKRLIVFEMTDENGEPVDCTGYTFKLGVKGKISDVAYKIAVFNATLSIGTTGLMSLVTWTFLPDMTKSIEPFVGVYETALYDGSGDKVLLTEAAGLPFIVEKALIPVT